MLSTESSLQKRRPNYEVLPGVIFGREDELLSPAYWAMRCESANIIEKDFVSQSGTLAEEIGFCLLGGYGVTLEVAEAFYGKLKHFGVFDQTSHLPQKDILALLNEPANVKGRPHRYRFPKQRAKRLHTAMSQLTEMNFETSNPIAFRKQIQSLEGVGPKTASWIVRNWLGSDKVAILDIHVLRAGWVINLFHKDYRLPRDYFALENRFIIFAEALNVRASTLDAIMWTDMRKFGSKLIRSIITA